MNLKWTKFNVNTVKFKSVLTNSYCKLFLSLELTSYTQESDDSKRTGSSAQRSALSEIVSLVCLVFYSFKNNSMYTLISMIDNNIHTH